MKKSIKILSITGIVLGLLIGLLYLLFLIVPPFINVEKYHNQIAQEVLKSTGLEIKFEKIRLYTTPNFRAGVRISNIELNYPKKSNIAKAKYIGVKINLVKLLSQTIEITTINVEEPYANIRILKNGRTDVDTYIEKHMVSLPKPEAKTNTKAPEFKISTHLPKVKIEKYSFNITDDKTPAKIKLTGKGFYLASGNLEKKIKYHLSDNIVVMRSKMQNFDLPISKSSAFISLKNDNLKVWDLHTKIYGGDIKGGINYNLKTLDTNIKMNGGNLNFGKMVGDFAGLKNMTKGTLSFNTNLNIKGDKLQTLNGFTDFKLINGHLGAKLSIENFIASAGNISSNKLISGSIRTILKSLQIKDVSKFAYLKGHLTFKNGNVNISPFTMAGPYASMYISGTYNLISNYAKMEVLGSISTEVVGLLGPLGNVSVSTLLNNLGKVGAIANSYLNTFNVGVNSKNISRIPNLSPMSKTKPKAFMVVIDGNVANPKAVRSFRWVATEQEYANAQKTILNAIDLKQVGKTLTKTGKELTKTGQAVGKNAIKTSKTASKNALKTGKSATKGVQKSGKKLINNSKKLFN